MGGEAGGSGGIVEAGVAGQCLRPAQRALSSH